MNRLHRKSDTLRDRRPRVTEVARTENIKWRKELAVAGVATIIPFIVATILRSNGGGKWLSAGASGAIGALAATAVMA